MNVCMYVYIYIYTCIYIIIHISYVVQGLFKIMVPGNCPNRIGTGDYDYVLLMKYD